MNMIVGGLAHLAGPAHLIWTAPKYVFIDCKLYSH